MSTMWVKTSKNYKLYTLEEYVFFDDGKVVGKVQDIFVGYTDIGEWGEPIFKWQGWFKVGGNQIFPTHNYDMAEDVKMVVDTGYAWGHTLDFWAINDWEKGEWRKLEGSNE